MSSASPTSYIVVQKKTLELVATQQEGYGQFRSTKDHATYMYQEFEDVFQEHNLAIVAWTDLQEAFDNVWTAEILVTLQRVGVANGSSLTSSTANQQHLLTESWLRTSSCNLQSLRL